MTDEALQTKKFDHKQIVNWFLKDKKWSLKVLALAGILLPVEVLATVFQDSNWIMLLYFIYGCIFWCFFAYMTHNKIVNNDTDILDIKKDFISVVFKYMAASIIFIIPSIPFVVFDFFLIDVSNDKSLSSQTALVILFAALIIAIIGFIVALISLLYYVIGYLSFVIDFKFSSFFSFKKMGKLLKNNIKFFFKLLCFYILYAIPFFTADWLIGSAEDFVKNNIPAIVILCLIACAISTIGNLIMVDLDAQFVRKALNMDEQAEEN